jgi:uncharacterized protein
MIELPLFPLDLVLFPGMPLELRIFEERYKEMINLCIEEHKPFGVVLIQSGAAELWRSSGQPAIPYMTGTTAQITRVRPMHDGQILITIVGKERFEILSLSNDKSYLTGVVEMSPIVVDESPWLEKSGQALRRWIERYLRVLENAGEIQPAVRQLPPDPTALAYLAAVLLQGITNPQKQELLQSETLEQLIRDLREIYRHEVVLLEALLSPPKPEHDGPFSLN